MGFGAKQLLHALVVTICSVSRWACLAGGPAVNMNINVAGLTNNGPVGINSDNFGGV